MAAKALLQVKIRDTNTVIYEGSVDRISSYNEMGPFDVFPTHANFISIIRKNVALYSNHQKVKEVPIEQAVMKVKKDGVSIFLGIETLLLEEIDPPRKN